MKTKTKTKTKTKSCITRKSRKINKTLKKNKRKRRNIRTRKGGANTKQDIDAILESIKIFFDTPFNKRHNSGKTLNQPYDVVEKESHYTYIDEKPGLRGVYVDTNTSNYEEADNTSNGPEYMPMTSNYEDADNTSNQYEYMHMTKPNISTEDGLAKNWILDTKLEDLRKSKYINVSCGNDGCPILGKGEYGIVTLASCKCGECGYCSHNSEATDIKVAIKVIKGDNITNQNMRDFIDEAIISNKFNDDNVVKMYGLTKDTSHTPWGIVYKKYNEGSLDTYLKKQKTITYTKVNSIILGIAKGMKHIHDKGYVHRDLAARNVLLEYNEHNDKITALIADFGMTKIKTTGLKVYSQENVKELLPLRWCAPELIVNLLRIFSEATDIWAFAITCIEIWQFGMKPYPSLNHNRVISYLRNGYIHEKPVLCPENFYTSIIKPCLIINSTQRPTFEMIIDRMGKNIDIDNKTVFTKPGISNTSLPQVKPGVMVSKSNNTENNDNTYGNF